MEKIKTYLFFLSLFLLSSLYSQQNQFDKNLKDFIYEESNWNRREFVKQFKSIKKLKNFEYSYIKSESIVDSVLVLKQNGNREKNFYQYDSRGNIVVHTKNIWNNGKINDSLKTIYTYNIEGKIISDSSNIWSNNELVWGDRTGYNYDSNSNLIFYLSEIWDGSNWVNYLKETLNYDINGDLISSFSDYWSNNTWTKFQKRTCEYDFNRNKTLAIFEKGSNNSWIYESRYTIEYNSDNNITLEIYEFWKDSNWINGFRHSYSYNKNNLTLDLMEIWDIKKWVNRFKTTYSYDSEGNNIFTLLELWDSGEWVKNWYLNKVYDSYGNITSEILELWLSDKNNWIYHWRRTYDYDLLGNFSSHLSEHWSGSEWYLEDNSISFFDGFGREFKFTGSDIKVFYNTTPTNLKEEDKHITDYFVSQNYPNPFNPTTRIKYSIPKFSLLGGDGRPARPAGGGGLVTLKVYDVLGKEVAILVNKVQPAGSYEVEFKANNLTSGVYFYTLQTGGFVGTKKMILIR